jgi:hypothetical protein
VSSNPKLTKLLLVSSSPRAVVMALTTAVRWACLPLLLPLLLLQPLLTTAIEVSADCARLREVMGVTDTTALFALPGGTGAADELAFLHIPKTGGTSLSNAYGRLFIDHAHMRTIRGPGCSSYWHVPPRRFGNNPYAGKKVFCVVRDPVEKAFSEYKMRFNAHLNVPNIVGKVNDWLRAGVLSTGGGGSIDGSGPWIKGGLDCHMVPQYIYVWDDKGQRTCDYIIRFENNTLLHDYNQLLSTFPSVPKEKLIEHSNDAAYHFNYYSMSKKYPITTGNLSAQVLKLVREYYWRDMCLFGYDTSISEPSSTKMRPP